MKPLLEVQKLRKHFAMDDGVQPWLRRLRAWASHTEPRWSALHAVDNVSFTIGEGESVGLVGESGCGKSTLVSLLARLDEPTDGAIRFEGNDIASVPAKAFARHPLRSAIQVVFQDPHESLNPRYTAFDAIAEPLHRLCGMSGDKLAERVDQLAEQVGLNRELLNRLPHQLSGGQKARVNIARALAPGPRLLILDEPTSALDVSVQAVILKLLAQLREEVGVSYLFVSHDLNVVRLLCDRVIVMYLGQIAEEGPSESIFEQPAHPYTQSLISAIPRTAGDPPSTRLRLEGDPSSPIDPDPQVCLFAGRCPRAEDRCWRAQPELQGVGENHRAACHFAPAVVDTGTESTVGSK